MSEALAQLATRHGIAPEFDDIWGQRHRVPDTSLRALLAAMGVEAGDEAAVAEALRADARLADARAIAPMVVVRHSAQPYTLHVRLPRALDPASLRLFVTAEVGVPCDDVRIAAWRDDESDPPSEATRAVCVEVAAALPLGYHDVELRAGDAWVARTRLAVAPATCYLSPPSARRVFGAAAQLYAVRSARNWGIGDFTDLATAAVQWGQRGAGVIGVNPLHALYPAMPDHVSPYSPSSRLFRNVLYLDVEAVREFAQCEPARERVRSEAFASRLASLRESPLVDYAGVAAAKLEVLALLHRHFRERHLAALDARADAFLTYCAQGGESLRRQALFDALHEHFRREDAAYWGWPAWPEAYRDPAAPDVARFAEAQAERVEFFQYLQWQAEQQFAVAAERARDADMAVGIYNDLAVSIDRGGAEAWASQDFYALGVSVGAPPDAFNMKGQDWGLPPLIPERLREAAYAPFLATLRANMRHAGALRIDHVMGLARLFWVPAGAAPADGAYVHYPFEDLLGLVALESHRHRCIVIGEDLGTVPDYVRAALAANAMLSYRVLIFEREGNGQFKPPEAYPGDALATATTHDLPTLAGWWAATDIALRAAHGLTRSADDEAEQARERAQDRGRLLDAFVRAGVWPEDAVAEALGSAELAPALALAAAEYLARSPSRLCMTQLEDVLLAPEQVNLPGTVDAYPNWRRKLSLPLERWPGEPRFERLTALLARVRPRQRMRTGRGRRMRPRHVPRATYRVQLNATFTFAAASALVPYLATLGISHVYCSPYLRARPGSTHGYDVVDFRTLNPELGTREDFEQFVATLAAHGMGHLCDVVPNHAGVMGADNAWWLDVLENGEAAASASFFDIDWAPFDADLAGHVLVPVLGGPYGEVLERGELAVVFEPALAGFAVAYFGHRFPIDPREYPALLAPVADGHAGEMESDAKASLARLVAALRALPPRTAIGVQAETRRRECASAKAALAQLVQAHPEVGRAIQRTVATFNGVPGQPETFERLNALLEAQAYRLAYWRVASDEINYRRFFDINELAALRMENDEVFEATHAFTLELAAGGRIHGLRIDHPDGLYDPAAYFARLQSRYREGVAATGATASEARPPVYVVVEKITALHERLPETWRVSGATGYRFANLVNGLFVARGAKARLDRAWRAFVGDEAEDYPTTVYRSKQEIMRGPLAAERTIVSHRALRIARGDRRTRDLTLNALRAAIAEIAARFPVYRSYVDKDGPSAQDRRYIDWAVLQARRGVRAGDASVYDFLHALLLGEVPAGGAPERAAQCRAFAMRFAQFTAPVAAKGVEDTAFYRFNRLVSLNDVGGDPDQFGMTIQSFHRASQVRLATWPHTMLATSTHDNKRSEDVRARIDVISEIPAAFRLAVRRWSRMNRSRKREILGSDAPSRNDEYLLYQTLVGTFPADPMDEAALGAYRERIEAYMLKAIREAKVRTSWLNQDADYEEAMLGFVRALLTRGETNRFLDDLAAQARVYAWFGALNSLSLALLKFASPGVPDLYQGHELVELRLVDPDNRVEIDYDLRRRMLAEQDALANAPEAERTEAFRAWLAAPWDGRAKLWVTTRLLRYRALHPEILADGGYRAVRVRGTHAEHAVSFARQGEHGGAIAVASRLTASLGTPPGTLPLGDAWAQTTLDLQALRTHGPLTDVLTGQTIDATGGGVPLAGIFRHFPVALLRYARA